MNHNLFLCNTVYQVLIAVWLRYNNFMADKADIIISNHMNGYKTIAENIMKTELFENVYTADSLAFSKGNISYESRVTKFICRLFPKYELKNYFDCSKKYNKIFFSNCDKFSALVYDVFKRKNRKLKLFLMEDGTSTYSMLIKDFYEHTKPNSSWLKRFAFKYIFGKHFIYRNVLAIYAFRPDLMEWSPDFPAFKISPINHQDTYFKECVNTIFNYNDLEDSYSEKYIIFEESFFAETGYMEDVELIKKLAEIVGKENIFIKIHPRNQINRFEKLGFKTNKNTFIPWEVIAMNMDITNKKLVAIISTSILNPVSVLGMNSKGYSLIECLKDPPEIVNGTFGKCVVRLFENFSNNICICKKIEDIIKEIK